MVPSPRWAVCGALAPTNLDERAWLLLLLLLLLLLHDCVWNKEKETAHEIPHFSQEKFTIYL